MSEASSSRPDKIAALWEAFLSSQLDDAGAQSLLEWLESRPAELDACRKEARVSLGLQFLLQPERECRQFQRSILSRLEGKIPGRDSTRLKRGVMAELRSVRTGKRHVRGMKRKSSPAFATSLAAAAALLACIGVAWLLQSHGDTTHAPAPRTDVVKAPVVPTPLPVAVVAGPTLVLNTGAASVDNRALELHRSVDVKMGASITLEPNAEALLTLSDGSTFKLVDRTALALTDLSRGAQLRLERGRLEVHAAHQLSGNRLIVDTPHASVAVVGTEYSVDALADRSRFAVQTGTVAVTPAGKAAAPQNVAGGEEVWADEHGLYAVRSLARRREVPIGDASIEGPPGDPVTSTELPGATFGGLPLRHLSYVRPKGESGSFAGVNWPVTLQSDETQYEIWIRPSSVHVIPQVKSVMVAILLQMGDTEYVGGYIDVFPGENSWRVLTGRLDNADVNWVRPQTPQLPRKAELVKHIALRAMNGAIEFDHTPVLIWR